MVQSGRGPRLATEAFEDLRVLGDFIRQKFQRRKATEHGVLGLVDHPHPAAAQLLDNAVMRDGLPNHAIGPWACTRKSISHWGYTQGGDFATLARQAWHFR